MPSCSQRYSFMVPVIQTALWVSLMIAVYHSALNAWPHALKGTTLLIIGDLWAHFYAYLILTLVYIFFPIGGFLGDVYLGRYRAVVLSLIVMAVTLTTTGIGSALWFKKIHTLANIMLGVSFVLMIGGLSLFNSNLLQFGLDQLMERPSESLGVFVHWLTWVTILGRVIPHILFAVYDCHNKVAKYLLYVLPVCFLVMLIVLLLVIYCTRQYFNKEKVRYNPYKMIFKVLNFARKNKYPVGPVSAFAYCDNFRPSRLDYAKERYGGPFTTSDVEDVKAFKNVFLVLLALGPVFSLDAAHSFLFKYFTSHTGASIRFGKFAEMCENSVDIVFSGAGVLLAVPVYIWLIYSVFRNRRPKILHRLAAAALAYILAVTSMLAIDLTGHIMLHSQDSPQPMCMFVQNETASNQTLRLHWMAIAVPKFSTNLAFPLTVATSFELISAQSPHAMRGVLVGSFFAIIGIFRAVGTMLLIPFGLERIWLNSYLGQHIPLSCGFGYYLACITVAMIGFISFIVAVKRYKYRRRDEEPYSQACVEEIFARRLENNYLSRNAYEELRGTNDSSPTQPDNLS